MHSYLRAIGFSKIKTRNQLEQIYQATLRSANRKIMTQISIDTSMLQIEKDFGPSMGIALVGEYDMKKSLSIEHYFPYFKGSEPREYESVTIEKQTDKESYAGVCDDCSLSNTIIFYLANIADYAKSKWLNYSNRNFSIVTMSAMSINGRVLLGVDPSMTSERVRRENKVSFSTWNSEARKGSEDAFEKLVAYESENNYIADRRSKTEDVFTIVDSSFYPCGVECDHYMVLGNIKSVKKVQNSFTDEYIYQLLLEAKDLEFDVCINEVDLEGEPEVGRRFFGEIWLQGIVKI